MGNLI